MTAAQLAQAAYEASIDRTVPADVARQLASQAALAYEQEKDS